MYDRVVTINNTHWPAYRKPGATLVDLRMFDPDESQRQSATDLSAREAARTGNTRRDHRGRCKI